MAAKFVTLNINGMNNRNKQQIIFDFIKENNFKFVNLQEHNLKDKNILLDIFYEHFHVIIKECISLKGGTAILIDKCLDCKKITN